MALAYLPFIHCCAERIVENSVSLCGDLIFIKKLLLLTLAAYVPLTKTFHLTTSSSKVEINQTSLGMSGQARAMWWDSEEPLRGLQDKSGITYTSEPNGYMGIQRCPVQVQVHPDWRAQLLLEQVRAAESEQALD
jgi:hypothetical protein